MARRRRPAQWHTQNFLRDPALASMLIDRAGLTDRDLVYEIGTGSGTITKALAERCRSVIANEIDGLLCEALRAHFVNRPTVQVRCGDFRAQPLPPEPYKVFANPPFDITSEIIQKLVGAYRPPEDAFLVVQREAAARYCGDPQETLAALLLKPFFAPSVIHRFHRADFVPSPGVEVVMLRLRKRGPPLIRSAEAQAYGDLVVSGFTAWKPTIGAALARPLGAAAARRLLNAASVDSGLAPSQVPFEAWLRLHAAFMRMPDALRDRIGGAQTRLRAQQAVLRKEHRSRAPRDELGPARPNLGPVTGGSPAMLIGMKCCAAAEVGLLPRMK